MTTETSSGIPTTPHEDEDSWVPLHAENTNSNGGAQTTASPSGTHTTSSTTTPAGTTPTGRHTTPTGVIQRRLQTRMSLRTNLVDHPIDLFWRRYLLNLAHQIWELDLHIRLGILLVVSGLSIKFFLLSTWYLWNPRLLVLIIVFVFSFFYLDPFNIWSQLGRILTLLASPDLAPQVLQQLDATGLRQLTFFLLMVPTLLESRTLSFLSTIKAESGWTLYNFLVGIGLFFLMTHALNVKRLKPRECLYQGLVALYGSALLVTVWKTDIARMPVLAGPFFTATGTLLITYNDDDMEWISRVLRHALRLTLRDVLSSMGERVSEDEMLQLAILRWVADYWASTPTPPPSQTTPSSTTQTPPTPPPASEPVATPTPPPQSPRPQTTTSRPRQSASTMQGHEVTWDELLPMLSIATDHMSSEVRMLQADPGPGTTGQSPTPPRMGQASPSHQTASSAASQDSLTDFQTMLASLDVDERAEPAVRAYQAAVEAFPPQKSTAVAISMIRRCPAVITLLWHWIVGSDSLLSSTMILLPFCFLEYHRILVWIEACEQMKTAFALENAEDGTGHSWIPSQLADTNSMVILLSGETYSAFRGPPTLLLVWRNVVSSVSALEVGLTAARCAETTAVAVQFAGNVMSLLQFGHEVQRHGVVFGLAVMAKEIILMSTSDEAVREREATKYTHAALGAVQNAQKVARNVQTLSQEDRLADVVQPVVSVFSAVTGYGWLWGGEPAADTTEEPRDSANSEGSSGQQTSQSATDAGPEANTGPTPVSEENSATSQVELADVMELVASAYEQGRIDEAQKNQLCEKLSVSSQDGATDPSVLSDVKETLDTAMKDGDQSHAEPQTGKNALPSVAGDTFPDPTNIPVPDRSTDSSNHEQQNEPKVGEESERVSPSAVMELVLAAYYRGLISQTEKTAFCQRLAELDEAERSNPAVVSGMLRTLQAITGDGDNDAPAQVTVSDKFENKVAPDSSGTKEAKLHTGVTQASAMTIPVEKGNVTVETETNDPGKDEANAEQCPEPASSKEGDTTKQEVAEEEASQPNPDVEPLSSNSETGSPQCDDVLQPNEGGDVDSANDVVKGVSESVARNSGVGNDDPAVVGSATLEQDAPDTPTESTRPEMDVKDAWLKFGAAALGAVVSGVLASQQQGNTGTDGHSTQGANEHANTSSTVQIEEIHEEGEGDWVACEDK